MIQYGTLSSIMYTCSLSLHFLLRIRYKWSPSRLLAKAHPTMHFLCICLPLVSAILAWCKTLYNPTPNCCYIQSYPNICGTADSDACIRGANAMWYLLAMYQVPIFVGLFFIIGAMIPYIFQSIETGPTNVQLPHRRRVPSVQASFLVSMSVRCSILRRIPSYFRHHYSSECF